jgi:hypothetical protein
VPCFNLLIPEDAPRFYLDDRLDTFFFVTAEQRRLYTKLPRLGHGRSERFNEAKHLEECHFPTFRELCDDTTENFKNMTGFIGLIEQN